MKTSLYLILLTLTHCWSTRSLAQDRTRSPYFYISGNDPDVEAFPLLHTEAKVHIAGVIADVQVSQVYCNSGKKPIEAVYVFPASTRAATYDMQMRIGDRLIRAEVREKQLARQNYEDARRQGKSASLLEQHRPNVFQMSVANIMPGDTIRVELKYTELLTSDQGTYEFVYPTVVGPRYGGEIGRADGAAHQWVENSYLEEGKKATYSFDIKIGLNAGVPVKSISCPSHKVDISYAAKDRAAIRLDAADMTRGNKDFILHYRLKGEAIQNGLLVCETPEENFFLMMVQPPAKPKAEDMPGREYIFVVDVSGSMHGYPLDISRKLMRDLLGGLRPDDRFNVLLFESSAAFLNENSLPVNAENIEKALQVIDGRRGGGGTNMQSAVRQAMTAPKLSGYSRSFVILTDGYVAVEPQIFNYIEANLGQANFFAFGIGTSVNRHLIEGIAYVGQGEPFVVTGAEEAPAMASRFRNYIQTPALTDLSIRFDGMDVYDLSPPVMPDLMAERPLVLFGKYRGRPSGKIEITGNNGNGKFHNVIHAGKVKPDAGNSALRHLWARHKIKMLSDYSNPAANPEIDLPAEITQLGLRYNLLTQYTSFVAIDSVVRNPGGESEQVRQPLPLPEGVSKYAVGEARQGTAQTGTEGRSASVSSGSETVIFVDEAIEIEPPRSTIPPPPPPLAEPNVEEIFKVVEEMPRFPGCEDLPSAAERKTCADGKMLRFIYSNFKYPESLKESAVSGTVFVQFTVQTDGTISDIEIVRSLHPELDKETLRIFHLMMEQGLLWTPGKQRGRPVKFRYNLPIRIELER